ncbi:MAG: hypothetical protein JWL84_976 [Rhodospirillales bacterium]|jgi:hypothetical protein|nr:hypothetical protein [Rhodospirillales bacterium]
MRSLVFSVASLLVLAACAGKPDDAAPGPAVAANDQMLPDGQSAVTPGPNGPVLHVGKNRFPLYPPP